MIGFSLGFIIFPRRQILLIHLLVGVGLGAVLSAARTREGVEVVSSHFRLDWFAKWLLLVVKLSVATRCSTCSAFVGATQGWLEVLRVAVVLSDVVFSWVYITKTSTVSL